MDMILNDFRKEKVLSIYENLKNSNTTNIVFWVNDLKYYNEFEWLALMYEPLLHRIFILTFDDGPIYSNPDSICELVPEKHFLKKIIPSDDFKKNYAS